MLLEKTVEKYMTKNPTTSDGINEIRAEFQGRSLSSLSAPASSHRLRVFHLDWADRSNNRVFATLCKPPITLWGQV